MNNVNDIIKNLKDSISKLENDKIENSVVLFCNPKTAIKLKELILNNNEDLVYIIEKEWIPAEQILKVNDYDLKKSIIKYLKKSNNK